MLDAVKEKLKAMGLEVGADQDFMLKLIRDSAAQGIKNNIGQDHIPKELHHVWINRIIGEWLMYQKNTKQLEGFDLDAAVKQIKTGDTTTIFAVGEGSKTDEQRIEELVSYLLTYGSGQLSRFRCITW